MRRPDPATTDLVRPLLVYGLSAWVGVAVLETAATATFVAELGAGRIPVVNLIGAALAALLGLGYARLQRAGEDGSRSLGIVVWTVAAVAIALALGLGLDTTTALVFLGLVLYRLAKIVMPMALWDAASERLDIGQGKRLFGLVGATQPIGRVAAYVSVPLLVTVVGTTGLFAVAAVALGVAAVSLSWARRPARPVDGAASWHPAATPVAAPSSSIGAILRSRMVVPMLALAATTTAVYTILSYSFSRAGGERFADADSLATAVALVSATSASLAAIVSVVAARRVLRRFGVPGAVAIKGVTVALGGLAMAAIAGSSSVPTVVFLTVAGLRIVEDMTAALAEPAVRLLGRVLPPARRAVVNAAVDGVVAPGALALASLIIIVLEATGANSFGTLGLLIAAIAAAGAVPAWALARDYPEVLREALAERRIDLQDTELDAEALAELDRVLVTGTAPAVAWSLDLLARADPEGEPARLAALIGHPDPRVRLDVLARIESSGLVDLVPAIRARIPTEGAPEVRGASARVVAALEGPDALDDVLPYLAARDPALRRGAMAGLLRSGDIEAILAAGEPLLALVRSDDPSRRREAALVLGEGGHSGLHRPLGALLADPDPSVVEAALRAAPEIGHPSIWPAVVDQLTQPTLRADAQRALERGGHAALEAVSAALPGALVADRGEVPTALLTVVGRMGRAAVPVLISALPAALAHDDRRVGDRAVAGLLALRHRVSGAEAGVVETDLDRGVDTVAGLLADEDSVLDRYPDTVLVRALVAHLRLRRRQASSGLLSRWALLQDPEVAARVVAVLGPRATTSGSAEDRSYAIESLETGPNRQRAQLVAAAVTTSDPLALRVVLAPRMAIDLTDGSVLGRLLVRAGRWDAVLAGLTLQVAADIDPVALGDLLGRPSAVADAFVTTTRRQLEGRRLGSLEESAMMTPVERMLALKSSDLLADADDDVLAEILDHVTDREVSEGEVLFAEGGTPDRLLLVLSGHLELSRTGGDERSVGPGDLAGELAVLDGTPYTATATVRQAGTVFEFPAPVVELLLAAEPTFSRQLLRRLARRARLAETGHGGVDHTMASILDRLVEGDAP